VLEEKAVFAWLDLAIKSAACVAGSAIRAGAPAQSDGIKNDL